MTFLSDGGDTVRQAQFGARLHGEWVLDWFHIGMRFQHHRHGDPISTGFVESAVNQIVSKRFVKKQQMAWVDQNAHDLLQVRTTVLNDELRDKFEQWYPSMAANEATTAKAA